MPEIYFCPNCSEQINMSNAVCPHCGTDISPITRVKSKSTSNKVEELEDKKIEKRKTERKGIPNEPISKPKSGVRFRKWLYALFSAGLIWFGTWLYNNFYSSPEIKNIFSKILNLTKGNNESTDTTKTIVPIQPEDFIGEWTNTDEKYSGKQKADENNIIIAKKSTGEIFVVFKRREETSNKYNYIWTIKSANSATCMSVSKKNPSKKGLIELVLSAEKDYLTFSILDVNTGEIVETRLMKRVE